MWNPPIALTSEEQKIAVRTRKTRKFFVFLREHRHELLDADFQHMLAQRIGKSNGIFAPVSPGAHPRRPTARTPHRLFVLLPVPVGRLVSVVGQHEPWRMRRVLLGRPFCLPYPR